MNQQTGVLLLLSFLLFFSNRSLQAQQSQTVKGLVLDRASEKPLQGATVSLQGTALATLTNAEGRFALAGVPLGRQRLAVNFSGYREAVIPEILVTAGKEVVLEIGLDQKVTGLQEVTITAARPRKGAAANEYAVASSRSFNMDEVLRFSGGRNDPSKMVSNFAGVVSSDDSRNDIVVRGNSPSGVLWRVEGIPSANPNHYALLGTTGGPVTALNTNALKTSDFLTGAFPAEFGNATAAVFDIQFRNGNSDRHERTLQLQAFSGLEALLEGPLPGKKKGGSYLAGYRYSFAQLAQKAGINIGTKAVPKYQDWVYNLSFAKGGWGKWNLYGMGGFSTVNFIGSELDSTDFYSRPDQDAYNRNNFSVFGAKHILDISGKAYVKTVASYSQENSRYNAYQYPLPVPPYHDRWEMITADNSTRTLRLASYINSKESARLSWRAGGTAERYGLASTVRDREGQTAAAPFRTLRDYDNGFTLLQGFGQAKYNHSDRLSLTAGLHGMWLTFNGSTSVEPRASAAYQLNPRNSLYASYGLHAQMQPIPVYLYQQTDAWGAVNRSNRDLGFTRAHHFVLGYEKRFGTDWRLKTEAYHQQLFRVPVERTPSGFSMLNAGNNFTFPDKTNLVNSGTGTNTGLEFTLEKFLSRGYYLLVTASLFDSRYKGSDGVERNTAFNYGRVLNVLAGKEWKIGQNNALTFDTRLSTVGGRYETPVDAAASRAAGKEIFDESRYNSQQLEGYFRWDTKAGWRTNSKKRRLTQTFYLDIQNVTNRKNIFLRRYNAAKGTVGNVYQLGFFPDVLYRVQW
ncbi:TonB-dependent receptor [Paraflavisolibacter sp. H34]|uniref:TonB-dependent receptor n=1 Tax=Huijunlia imazamoxiresistens TaxID=3127457 RepID=UPI00301A0240